MINDVNHAATGLLPLVTRLLQENEEEDAWITCTLLASLSFAVLPFVKLADGDTSPSHHPYNVPSSPESNILCSIPWTGAASAGSSWKQRAVFPASLQVHLIVGRQNHKYYGV